ncbi:putative General transcription factor 3C polypeptide 1 [Paratrimastix pyriformis]|uniref:General transcription factor 3C polypeptide 1 n=1 Tax=Paratrimastix pyriformis TaxID=342808 RepID=A0ABQ8UQQ0_9EUKA|nr:putative General transcription factor 3C polypeptide 1 [Paratrimastix pyriformis]
MKVKSQFLQRFHLNRSHYLLSARCAQVMLEFFEALDISDEEAIDDIQFKSFMKDSTDCSDNDAEALFDMFDVDASGQIEFDEFFLLICLLIAVKDREEKQFLYYHSRTCFELIDADGSQQISTDEFVRFGSLFNISKSAIYQIFTDFDVSGDHELDYDEFRLFTIAAIDRQRTLDEQQRKLHIDLPAGAKDQPVHTPTSQSGYLTPHGTSGRTPRGDRSGPQALSRRVSSVSRLPAKTPRGDGKTPRSSDTSERGRNKKEDEAEKEKGGTGKCAIS